MLHYTTFLYEVNVLKSLRINESNSRGRTHEELGGLLATVGPQVTVQIKMEFCVE